MERMAPRSIAFSALDVAEPSERSEVTAGSSPDPDTPGSRRRALFPAQSPEESADRLLVATLRVRIPDRIWLGPFSRRHPGIGLEVLGRSEIGRTHVVADIWIGGRPAGIWRREIARYSDVSHVDCLAEVGPGSLYRVRFVGPPVIELYRQLEVPLPFPMRVQGGAIEWEVVARAPEFQRIVRFAQSIDPHLRLTWTRRAPLRSHLPRLTRAQTALLKRAIAEGYFSVPRRITLVDLAREVNRSKSSVSEALARIELKLLESALYLPGIGGPA